MVDLSGVSSDPALTQVLLADPALAARLPPQVVDSALLLTVAPTEWLSTGSWDPSRVAGDEPGHLGLLVLEGMVVRLPYSCPVPAQALGARGDRAPRRASDGDS